MFIDWSCINVLFPKHDIGRLLSRCRVMNSVINLNIRRKKYINLTILKTSRKIVSLKLYAKKRQLYYHSGHYMNL